MDARHRGIQIFGWLSVVAGYGLALLLIRGIFVGITRGFRGGAQAFWLIVAYLLFLALAVHLFTVGRRAIFVAKGSPRPKARFGWERMLLGALLIFGAANTQFHFLPTRHLMKQLEYGNQTQFVAGNATAIALCVGCIFLIFSGIRKGFRPQTTKPDYDS